MTAISSSLIVKLIDGISAPARGAAKALAGIGEAARRVNGTGLAGVASNLRSMAKANEAHMDALRGKMVDAAAMGYGLARSLAAPLREARAFESVLLDIGQKANLTDAGIDSLGKKIGKLSVELKKTLSSTELAGGVDFLAGMGLDPDNALTMLEPIGRAAHAYKADVQDLARAGYAAFDNLKVPAEEFGRALDVMAQSGKEGAFELRDMARYFPSLGATFQGFGQTGVKAVADLSAALQVARKGAGDSEEAATNLGNVLQKIAAPATVKNFRKFGIDIRKELEKAQKTGKSPIEMLAEQTNKALKGNLAVMGDLFEDAQVQKGLRAIIQNMDEYRAIRAKALSAEGVVDNDFARRLLTGDAALDQFKNRMADLGRTIGAILLPAVNDLLEVGGEWASAVADLAERHPVLTKAVIAATAAVVAFRSAAIAAAFAGRFMLGGALTGAIDVVGAAGKMKSAGAAMAAPFVLVGSKAKAAGSQARSAFRFWRTGAASASEAVSFACAGMGAALMRSLKPIRLVTAALRIMKLAVVGTGISAILVGIAMAGTWIYNNWKGIGVAFEAFKGAFDRAIAPVKPVLEPIISIIQRVADAFGRVTGALDNATWAQWGLAAGKAVGEAVTAVVEGVRKIVAAFVDLKSQIVARVRGIGESIRSAVMETDYAALGGQIISNLWEGMKGAMGALVGWIKSSIADAFTFPSMSAWLGGGGGEAAAPAGAGGSPTPSPAPLPRRARGGHVAAGRTYAVNDDGSRDPYEIFRPGKSGTILPASERRKLEGGSSSSVSSPTINQTVNITISGANDPRAVAQEVSRILAGETQRKMRGIFGDLALRGA
ncbi:phage tail tape measure protein [Aureimonas sp. Leaf324]|uniref:phage tail tape measure protein n=1 Tax=Aureimonas sp. Leaf324 TaxID=1736336 RepID=UPI0006F4972F|nr:phage tail tape measure protein [Aureimonas sp. Leaf324]KQQ83638.1 hypothetical protein ASF65_20450 [Aureimonas sp. Leaf324]